MKEKVGWQAADRDGGGDCETAVLRVRKLAGMVVEGKSRQLYSNSA